MVLHEYMKTFRNDVNNLFGNMHVQIKVYWEFYHGIIYIANERCTDILPTHDKTQNTFWLP